MRKQLNHLSLLGLAIVLFNLVFWNEGLGINLFIFTLVSLGLTFWLYPELLRNTYSKCFALSTLLSAIFVVVNHSILAGVVYFISYLIFIGCSFANHQFQIVKAGLLGIKNLVMGPFVALGLISSGISEHLPFKRFFYYLKLIFIPLGIIVVFLFLYSYANEFLGQYVVRFTEGLVEFFQNLSLDRVLFFILSFILVSAVLVSAIDPKEILKITRPSHELTRIRKRNFTRATTFSMIGLKGEYRIAQLTFLGLNVLIFIVNAFDIFYVWTGKISGNNVNLKSHLHEGTYMLIFSVLLAMLVVLVFFRGNLNFFPKNKKLRLFVYAWIIQNALLMISVVIRNYRYMQWHGLAYKRIGVLLFLLLVAYGLWTMYAKIKHRHTLKYLLMRNSLAVYIVLLLSAGVNWDTFITKFNLRHEFKGQIDSRHLLFSVSDKNYRILDVAKENLRSKPSYPEISEADIGNGLKYKREKLLLKRKNVSWLSWNYPDWKNWQYIDNATSSESSSEE